MKKKKNITVMVLPIVTIIGFTILFSNDDGLYCELLRVEEFMNYI